MPASVKPEICKMMTISTEHLPKRFFWADGLDNSEWEGVVVFEFEHGAILFVPDNDEPIDVPAELLTIQRFARTHGCNWVKIDADGPVTEGLVDFGEQWI